MSYYKFKRNDIFHNRLKTYPKTEFLIYGGVVYHNNQLPLEGAFSSSHKHVPSGHLSLYEINIDQPNRTDRTSTIYPFVTKEGSTTAFKTVSTSKFNSDFQWGDIMTGSYPLSASITRYYYTANHEVGDINASNETAEFNRIVALKNTFNYYTNLSSHYAYSSSLNDLQGGWNKGYQKANLISFPSIFYGSSIKKGSVELNFYITGTLVGQLRDEKRNGELLQTLPTGSPGSGNVGGVALYNEGFLFLTGTWDLSNGEHTEEYINLGPTLAPTWLHFGAGANDKLDNISNRQMIDDNHTSSHFTINFRGTNYIPTLTMLANAPKGELNHSNNPTYVASGSSMKAITSSHGYREFEKRTIKNIVSGAYSDVTPSFKKQTYISKIGIFDDNNNLIAIAKLANPVKKTEDRDITFKLKLDI